MAKMSVFLWHWLMSGSLANISHIELQDLLRQNHLHCCLFCFSSVFCFSQEMLCSWKTFKPSVTVIDGLPVVCLCPHFTHAYVYSKCLGTRNRCGVRWWLLLPPLFYFSTRALLISEEHMIHDNVQPPGATCTFNFKWCSKSWIFQSICTMLFCNVPLVLSWYELRPPTPAEIVGVLFPALSESYNVEWDRKAGEKCGR